MKLYLAYGSNLNKTQMAYRCPKAIPVGVSCIEDYGLVFRRGVLTIEPKKGGSVPVGVWRISASDEKALDRYEGFPRFYRKETFMVNIQGHAMETPAIVYIMNAGFPLEGPGRAYLQTVLDGYRDFRFGKDELRRLYDAVFTKPVES